MDESNTQYSLDDAIEHIGFGRFQTILFFVLGLSWMADSMEMMIISILAPVLMCEWNLSAYGKASLSLVVFIGQGIGALTLGYASDIFGRKKGLCLSLFLVLFFGILSSQAPSYEWMLVLRFCVGLGIGGVPQATIFLTEMLPVRHRAKSVILFDFFWAAGSVFAAVLALVMIDKLGWRYYLIVLTIPTLVFLLAAVWLPESPRFLLTTGKYDKAVSLIGRMCECNRRSLPEGTLAHIQINTVRGRLIDMFRKEWHRTSALLLSIWFTVSFCYFGIALLTTEMFQVNITGCQPTPSVSKNVSGASSSECKTLKKNDYTDFMWTSIAEYPGLLFAVLLINYLGRRKSLALQFFLAAIFFLFLMICTTRGVTVAFIFVARGFIIGIFMTTFVYTAEVLPTDIRAVGMGTCSMTGRLASMITPFVAQVLIHESFYYVVIVYSVPLLLCTVASLLLKIETEGRTLSDSSKTRMNDYESTH